MSVRYRVYFTPLASSGVYGDEVEVTDYVKDGNAGTIRRGLDSTDFDFGGFFYDDLQMTLLNVNGIFNDENDFRSIFPYSRDRTKVRVEYTDSEGDTIVFNGLISEEATRIDASADTITVRILSPDSVMRNVRVAGGTITNGSTFAAAMGAILNQPEITVVLDYDVANINPPQNYTIDDGSQLEGKSVREAMNQLLVLSNAVMFVNEDNEIIVTDRDEDEDTELLALYGPYDLKRRQNIIDIKNYNQGKHRMFTAVKVNDTEYANDGYVDQFGYRQKRISAPFITNSATEATLAEALVSEFKTPKIELEVTVPTKVARGVKLLQRVSIDSPLRIKAIEDKFLPIVGQAEIGDDTTPLPNKYGSIAIGPEMGFKIIEIKEDPRTFTTTLKLRQIGTDTGDGFFTTSDCALIGYSVIGVSTICGTGDPADTFNPSVIGAAQVGYTRTA